jgi:hypothetical protein
MVRDTLTASPCPPGKDAAAVGGAAVVAGDWGTDARVAGAGAVAVDVAADAALAVVGAGVVEARAPHEATTPTAMVSPSSCRRPVRSSAARPRRRRDRFTLATMVAA